MREYIEIGPVPADEECAQVGRPGYYELATAECRRFIELIRKKLGKEPLGAKLRIKSNAHDFGTYYEVCCDYDPRVPASVDYAFRVERDAPQTWED